MTHHKAYAFFSVVIEIAISDHAAAFIFAEEKKQLNQQQQQNISIIKNASAERLEINLFLNLNLVSVKKIP